MSLHRFPSLDQTPKYHVYALLCEDAGGPGYVKFGLSKRVGQRLTELRGNCPVPAKFFAIVEVGYLQERARSIEKALHERFASRRIKQRGEWFRFDFKSASDKAEFNAGCKSVFAAYFRDTAPPWWTKIPVAALDEAEKRRRHEFLNSKQRDKIIARARYLGRQRKTWKELG